MIRLTTTSPAFEPAFTALLGQARETTATVDQAVSAIIAEVRARGDAALIDYTARFDRHSVTTLRITEAEIDAATAGIPAELAAALDTAARRIEAFHKAQLPADLRMTDEAGLTLGMRWGALDSVGIYVPGGKAAYPSSVLMNAIPARAAGVARIAMCVPTPDGVLNPLVLAAAKRAGVSEIYRIGGAQAVAALAYGTESVAPVDRIVGPGNAYVAAAKREVFGQVGIDSIAGPSEILVISDAGSDPAWIAADLLSQAEHDASSQSILITDDAAFADKVAEAAARALAFLPRIDIATKSWRDHGGIIVVDKLADAAALSDRFAPEHLEIATADPKSLLKLVRHAGAIFLGRHTPEAMGDYIAGPNHVLPTSRSARFSSGLSVLDFMKRTTLLQLSEKAVNALGPDAITLAEAEGLQAHANSIAARLNRK